MIMTSSISIWAKDDIDQNNIEQRRQKIISIINEELSEVERLMAQSGGKQNPSLYLRMAELNLEKARLIRERETNAFMKLSPKKKTKVNRKKYFRESSKYFEKANNLCRTIIRRFKNFKQMADVYYILGYNAKEANKDKTAAKYLSRATRYSKNGQSKVKAQISLAEIYYNAKKYRKAIPLYEKALAKHQDKWWTKDSFNLAWCYFRVNKYTAAINKMKAIYEKSKSSRFIDMRQQVKRDIGIFFATSDRIDEGIRYYKKFGENFTTQLLQIAVLLKSQGKYTQARKVLEHASRYEKDKYKRVEINIEKLNLYEKYGKYISHNQVSKELYTSYKAGHLREEQKERYKYHMEKVAALLQRQVVSKTYRRLPKQRKQKANLTISYFDMLKNIDTKRSDEFSYLKGETAYAAGLYTSAFEYYKETFELSEKNKKTRFKKQSIDAMLVVLSRLPKQSDKFIYTFEAYLRNWPKGKKSKEVYSRLFNNYMSEKQYDKAESVLNRFVKYYPRDLTQEAMIAQLMDVSRSKKDNNKVRAWIAKIDKGNYYVSPKYKRKLQELLTAMQIEDVQGQLATGNKKSALVGYLDILNDKYSTKRSKINAKYNLSALYYELGNQQEAYRWAMAAVDEMSSKDVQKFSPSFVTIANFLFTSLEFEKSADLSRKLLGKLCKSKSKKRITAFKNGMFIYLSDGHLKKAEEMLAKGRTCKLPTDVIEEAEYETMREYLYRKDWKKYEYYALKLQTSKRYYAKVIDDFLNLSNIHGKFNNTSKAKRFLNIGKKLYYKAKRARQIISLRSLDYFASLSLRKMERTSAALEKIKLSFPEARFQRAVEGKLKQLDKLVEQGNDVLETGSGAGIVSSYKLLDDAYTYVAKELMAFTPPGKTKEYITGFKKQFNSISTQMLQAAKKYRQEARTAIRKNTILSKNNFYFQDNKFPVQFYGESGVVIMDRGGK